MIDKDLYDLGVTAAQGIQGRKFWWLRTVARCEVRAQLLDRRFEEASYPRGFTSAERWVIAFLSDRWASMLSSEVLQLHLDAGRGGRFQVEADLRTKVPGYREVNAGLRWLAYILGRPWELAARALRF